MEDIAGELGVPAEILLQGLPERLKHASDGVIIRRFARLGCLADFRRIRDAGCPDIARPWGTPPPRVRAHVMPYMPLRDSAAIRAALADDHGTPTAQHRQIVISNQGRLLAKYDAFRTINAQIDLIDSISEAVETQRSPLLRAQLEASVADLQYLKSDVHDRALRLMFHHLEEGDILEARQYIDAYFPRLSYLINNNESLVYESFEYLRASLREKFAGEQLSARDTELFLGSLSAYRLMYLKTANLVFLVASMECFLEDLRQKRLYLTDRLELRTLLGAEFAT